jgi:hypothetical protein
VADALAGLHARGVLHRDVKPANILIDGFGRPRLADFGLAAVVGAEAAPTDALRMTPAYAPPEAFTSAGATESGDVFSLAATLYALLAGHPPRELEAAGDLPSLVEGAAAPIPPLPGVNWFLMDTLMTALSTDGAARPTAAEFRDRLSTVPTARRRKGGGASHPGGRPVSASSPPLLRDTAVGRVARTTSKPPPTRTRRRVGILATAAALVMLAASGGAWLIAEPASSGAPTAAIAGAGLETPSSRATTAAPSPAGTPTQAPLTRETADAVPAGKTIRLADSEITADPFETVGIRGTYGGGAHRFLQVQWWSNGRWQTFPVPAKTDASGEFTAYVELGRPSSYRLRVRDPQTSVASQPVTLVIGDAGGA